ncbi:unnamed protein product [Cercopithifilaria johnstoni]|uniref:Uncharacterized protein n=1 Tax=Cercopithifilaria johnstoni TaxID=2874296 RepID=A0A8J2LUB3_9BILA|nr:unnamed protein product [Cercopithifilaria johnstoni]
MKLKWDISRRFQIFASGPRLPRLSDLNVGTKKVRIHPLRIGVMQWRGFWGYSWHTEILRSAARPDFSVYDACIRFDTKKHRIVRE